MVGEVETLQIVFYTLGSVTIFTYTILVCKYRSLKMDKVWAIWNDPCYFKFWVISAILAAVSFVGFSIDLFNNDPEQTDYILLLCAYTFFLFFACLYVPALLLDQKEAVITILALESASTIALSVWSIKTYYAWEGPREILLNVATLWLSFHCTVLDFILWGYSWYNWENYSIVTGTSASNI